MRLDVGAVDFLQRFLYVHIMGEAAKIRAELWYLIVQAG